MTRHAEQVNSQDASGQRRLVVHQGQGNVMDLLKDWAAQPGGLVVVPSVQAGRDLRRKVPAVEKTVTLTQLARLALREQGWTVMMPAQRLEGLRALMGTATLEYLSGVALLPGTADAVLRLLTELTRANLNPADVTAVARGARERDVATLFTRWVEHCEVTRTFDGPGAEYFAVRVTRPGPQRGLVHGFAYLDAAQAAWVDALLGEDSLVTLPGWPERHEAVARRPARTAEDLTRRGFTMSALTGPAGQLGARVVQAYVTGQSLSVPKHEFATVEEEVRACLRQVRTWLAGGLQAHRVAIMTGNEGEYLATLGDVALEYGVPLISGQQVPLRETPVGSVLEAWLDAHERDWRFGATRRLLTHPMLRWSGAFDMPARARVLQRTAPAGVQAWWDALAWLALPEEMPWPDALDRLERLLVEGGVRDQARVHPAVNVALSALLGALGGWAGREGGAERAAVLSELRDVLRTVSVPQFLGRAGVRVASPLAALGRDFDCVWILGLSEGLLPRVAVDDPLVDRVTRAAWRERGVDLPDLTVLASASEALFAGAVASARQAVVFSRSRQNAAGRSLAPGSYWQRLVAPVSAPLPLDWGSDLEKQVQDVLAGRWTPATLSPSLSSRTSSTWQTKVQVERDRAAGIAGEHHGGLADPVDVTAHRWSPSQLHSVGACRFRWFAERLLRLEEPSDPDEVEDRRAVGTLLHAALEGALKDWQASDGVDALLTRARTAFDAEERALVRSGDLRPGPLWPVTRQETWESVEGAVRSPAFLPRDWVPEQVEARREFTVQAGAYTYRMTGIVDRVDRTEAGLMVTDYKKGRYISHVQQGGKLNLEVQLPLYMLGLGAENGRYFSVERAELLKAAGPHVEVEYPRRKYRWAEHRANVETFLVALGDALARGDVSPGPDGAREACRYCRVLPVCRHTDLPAVDVSA